MSLTQKSLHSKKFEFCRLCMIKPESDRRVRFFDIFPTSDNYNDLSIPIKECLGIEIKKDDYLPKCICNKCHKFLVKTIDGKLKARESQIMLGYIHKRKYGTTPIIHNYRSEVPETNASTEDASNNCAPSTSRTTDSTPAKRKTVCRITTMTNVIKNYRNYSILSLSTSSNQSVQPTTLITTIKHESANGIADNLFDTSIALRRAVCLVCQMDNIENHDCAKYNKNISTCLVPYCNVISRMYYDMLSHYRQHMTYFTGLPLCKDCSSSSHDGHTNMCNVSNCGAYKSAIFKLYKCFPCRIIFKTELEFAVHKLKMHHCIFKSSSLNYDCLRCNVSSINMVAVDAHVRVCNRGRRVIKVEGPVVDNDLNRQGHEGKTNGNGEENESANTSLKGESA